MTRGRWLKIGAVALALLLGYAWLDGGREPLHEIREPLPLPGGTR